MKLSLKPCVSCGRPVPEVGTPPYRGHRRDCALVKKWRKTDASPTSADFKRMTRALDSIASWGSLIDDEPESRKIARDVLHELGLSPEGYRHETTEQWHARRRREGKRLARALRQEGKG